MNKTFDFCIVITTYNRPDMLYKLLDNIELEKKDFNLKIFVFNDGSTLDYDLSRFDITHIKFFPKPYTRFALPVGKRTQLSLIGGAVQSHQISRPGRMGISLPVFCSVR